MKTNELFFFNLWFKTVACTDKEPETICYDPGVNLDIDVKMHDELVWKVNTTSFTLKVYAKDTTYCE